MLSGPFNLSYLRFCLDDSLIRGKNILIKPYWNNDPSHRSSLRGGFLLHKSCDKLERDKTKVIFQQKLGSNFCATGEAARGRPV